MFSATGCGDGHLLTRFACFFVGKTKETSIQAHTLAPPPQDSRLSLKRQSIAWRRRARGGGPIIKFETVRIIRPSESANVIRIHRDKRALPTGVHAYIHTIKPYQRMRTATKRRERFLRDWSGRRAADLVWAPMKRHHAYSG